MLRCPLIKQVLVQAKVRFCIYSGCQAGRCGWMAAHNEGKDTTGLFFNPPPPVCSNSALIVDVQIL